MEGCQCCKSSRAGSNTSASSQSVFFGFTQSVCEVSRCAVGFSSQNTSTSSRNHREDNIGKGGFPQSEYFSSSRQIVRREVGPYCCTRMENYRIPSRGSLSESFRLIKGISEFANTVLNKNTLFLLVILLNLLFAGGSPTHRVRHRHLRHLNHDHHQRCDKPGLLDHPTHEECDKPRVRRDVNTMSLSEGQDTSLCSYSVCDDVDVNRTPVHINRVFCLQSGCRCTQEGSYRCTQLFNQVEVWYGGNQTTLEVEFGCVCAAKHGTTVEPFAPNTAER